MTKTIAHTGAVDQAITVATTITSPHQQVLAYLAVAEHADPGRQRQLLAKIMQTEHWSAAADVLARHSTNLAKTVDMCINLWKPRTVNTDDSLAPRPPISDTSLDHRLDRDPLQ